MHFAPACRSVLLIPVLLVATLLIGLSAVGIGWAGADPNALWTIVHDQCSPHEEQDGDPAPCALVDADDGYGVTWACLAAFPRVSAKDALAVGHP